MATLAASADNDGVVSIVNSPCDSLVYGLERAYVRSVPRADYHFVSGERSTDAQSLPGYHEQSSQ